MTIPVYKGTGTVFGTPGGASTTATIAAPASIAVDDILYLEALTNGSTTLSGLPTGWSHAPGSPVTSTGGSNNCTLNICTKRAVAGDVGASSYVFTLSASDYCEGAISNASGVINTGSPWDTGAGAPVFAKTSANATVAPGVSLTTQGADRLLINSAINQTGGTPWTASSGFTKDFDHTGGGTFSTATGYHAGQSVAGSTGTVAPTCPASGEMVNFLGAFVPAGGATTINGTATLAGAGSLTANSTLIAPAALAGAGALTPPASRLIAPASLIGAGALTPPNSITQAGAVLVGNGSVALVPSILRAGASLAGAGLLVASAGGTILGTATLVGAGSLSAAATLRAGASLAGVGLMSPVMSILRAGASLVGAGSLIATQAGSIHVTVWNGSSEIAVASVHVWDGASEIPATFASVV